MKTIAVICEYNPFHLGHMRQIEQIREQYGDCNIIALMSGNYVQRGELSLYPKHLRAKAAIVCGADLVLELPYPYSCGAASYFARAGISVLCRLGCVDSIVYGYESMDPNALYTYACRVQSEEFKCRLAAMRREKEGNLSDIVLHGMAYRALYGAELPIAPNDILGAEYTMALLACKRENAPTLCGIARRGPWSATAIRQGLRAGKSMETDIPVSAYEVFKHAPMPNAQRASSAMLGYFRLHGMRDFDRFDGAGGGFGMRIWRAAQTADTAQELYDALACKTATDASVRRTVLHCLFGTTRADLRRAVPYTVLLGANRRGSALLRRIRKSTDIPLLTKPVSYKALGEDALRQGELSLRADAFYALCIGREAGYVLKEKPYIAE